MTLSTASRGLVLLAAARAALAQDSCDNNDLSVSYPAPVAADGWSYRLVAEGLTKPRGILFDNDGGLLVVDSGVGLVHLSLDDQGGTCVSVNEQTTILENEDLNHGIALSEDGNTLYASTANEVYSWSYDAGDVSLDADSERTLVTNMSNSDHTTRTLLLSRSRPGTLLVSRGSDSNQDADAEDIDSGHSQIRAFDIGSLGDDDDEPYDFLDGDNMGWGLRNSVGVAEDPVTGGIWSVENSVDELFRNGEDVHTDNPAEELNFHGYLNGSAGDLEDIGGNYGYPLCYAIWSTEDFPDLGDMDTGDQFPGAETSTLTDESCNEDYVAPYLSFQAHTAPLDIKFSEDASEAFISFHGSWNREDPVGYRVASVSFSDGMPSSERTSMDAASDVLSTPDLSNCPDDCFRPVGLAWDSEGRLWVSSDSTGEIFVLERTSSSGGGDDGDSGDGSSGGSSGDQDDAGVKLMHSKVSVALGPMVVGFLLL